MEEQTRTERHICTGLITPVTRAARCNEANLPLALIQTTGNEHPGE